MLSLLAAASAGGAAPLGAQSSLFGVRGLGLPGRPLTPRTLATGGSLGLFDGESDLNPAAVAGLKSVAAGFVVAPAWRQWDVPAGTASLRDTRFPLVSIGGPVPGTRIGLGLSVGSYADRDFRLATSDTIQLRGAAIAVHDTLTALGGLSEIRFAAGYGVSPRTNLGAALYWITGSSRLSAHRVLEDTIYVPNRQSAELSYQGVGVAIGITHQLSDRLQVAALVRADGKASVQRDSSNVYDVDLPFTFSGGIQLRPSRRFTVAASAAFRTWSGANSDLQGQGGVGARNTLELGAGIEVARNLRRPSSLPIRLGVRYGELPFPVVAGQRPREFSLAAGTGQRFAQDRAGIDFSVEHFWRSEGSPYKERALTIVFGLSIRPYGTGR
jgi:hypothetical protein